MRYFLVLFFLLSPLAQSEVIDRIVAVVNDEIITQKDLATFRSRLQKGKFIDDLLIKDKNAILKSEKDLLQHMIDEKIIDSEIKRQDLAITLERVDQEILKVAQRNGFTKQQLFNEIKREGASVAEYQHFMKQRLERESLIQKVISSQIRISEEEIQNYYLSNFENKNLQVYEFTLAHILFRPKGGDKDAALVRAQAVLAKLKNGESFESLASQHSEDPNFTQGGLLGTFKTGEFIKELEDGVAPLQPNQYSDIIPTRMGFHILKLVSKNITKDPAYEAKKAEIQNILYEKAFAQQFKFWIDQKKAESFVRMN